MRSIEIDFDVHKLIEMERRGFEDPANAALRRLLGLPDVSNGNSAKLQPDGGWSGDGVNLPNGTQLRMSYNGRTYTAAIESERWVSSGRKFDSPSGAASGLAVTKSGKRTRLDGWAYWEAKLPTSEEWVRLSTMRSGNPLELTLEDLDL